eukprot:CAMPEP_0197583762 /NCGR_PEP_ID=MMETSP1326-20131121/6574_1 /TAXON_ID=1155430 /ORGANISM="Genus nov. species nov., Strain RCC2288" /LENGTH=275 /DNA_ID=CAMNT_0043148023 /DNA_START=812 /DNA_END=1638 /DNA_ORIENTATION=+
MREKTIGGVSKLIKRKHDSTVLSVSWHPSNVLIVTTCSDFKCRVFTTQVKGVDDETSVVAWLGANAKFGECLFEIFADGWIHTAAWSPSGTSLAFTTHDCTVQFIDGLHGPANTWAANLEPVKSVALPEGRLPLRDMLFLSDKMVVAAGYDCTPFLFEASTLKDTFRSWSFKAELGGGGGGGGKPVDIISGSKRPTQFTSGLAMFKAHSDLGLEASNSAIISLLNRAPEALDHSPHDNCVMCIRPIVISKSQPREHVSTFTTSGLDGMIVFWKID